MPIYEYECSKCSKTIEVIQKFSDKPLRKHGGCGGNLTKLISASGFHFKGTGWYVTDYARKGQSQDGDSSKTGSQETSSSEKSEKKEGSADKPAAAKADKKESSAKSSGTKD